MRVYSVIYNQKVFAAIKIIALIILGVNVAACPILANCITKCDICPIKTKICKDKKVKVCDPLLEKYDENHDNYIEENELPPPTTANGYKVFIAFLLHIPVCQIKKEKTNCHWVVVSRKLCDCRKVCNLPPKVEILQPKNGQKFVALNTVEIPVRVKVSDNQGIEKFKVLVDGKSLATTESCRVTLTPGTHTITAIAVNRIGKKASDSVTVEVVKDPGPQISILQKEGTFVYVGRGFLRVTALAKSEYGVRSLSAILNGRIVGSTSCSSDICVLDVIIPVAQPGYGRILLKAVDNLGAKAEKIWKFKVTNNPSANGTVISSEQTIDLGSAKVTLKEVGSTIIIGGNGSNIVLDLAGKKFQSISGRIETDLTSGIYKAKISNGKVCRIAYIAIPSLNQLWILTTKKNEPKPEIGGECFVVGKSYYCTGEGVYKIVALAGSGIRKWDGIIAGRIQDKTAIGGPVVLELHRFGLVDKGIVADLTLKANFWRMSRVPPYPVALDCRIFVNNKIEETRTIWVMDKTESDFRLNLPMNGANVKIVVRINFFNVHKQFAAEFNVVPDNPQLYYPQPPKLRFYKLINIASWVLFGYHPKRLISETITLDSRSYMVNTTAIVTPLKPGNPDYKKPCIKDAGKLYVAGNILVDGKEATVERVYYPIWNGHRDIVSSISLSVVPRGKHVISEIVDGDDIIKSFYASLDVVSPAKYFNLTVNAPKIVPLGQRNLPIVVHVIPGRYLGYRWCPTVYGGFSIFGGEIVDRPSQFCTECQLVWKLSKTVPDKIGVSNVSVKVCSGSGICRESVIEVKKSLSFISGEKIRVRVKIQKGYYPIKSVYLDPVGGDVCIIGKVDKSLKNYGYSSGYAYFDLKINRNEKFKLIAVDVIGDVDYVYISILSSKPAHLDAKAECGASDYIFAYVQQSKKNQVLKPSMNFIPPIGTQKCLEITDVKIPEKCVEPGKVVTVFFTAHSYCSLLKKAELFVNGKLVAVKQMFGRTESLGIDYVAGGETNNVKILVYDSEGNVVAVERTLDVCTNVCSISLNVNVPKTCIRKGICLIDGVRFTAEASGSECRVKEVKMYLNGKLVKKKHYDGLLVSDSFDLCTPFETPPRKSFVVKIETVGANGYRVSKYAVLKVCSCEKYVRLFYVPSHHSSLIFVKTPSGYYEIAVLVTENDRIVWLRTPKPAPDYYNPVPWLCTFYNTYKIYLENDASSSLVGKVVCGGTEISTVPRTILSWLENNAEVYGLCR